MERGVRNETSVSTAEKCRRDVYLHKKDSCKQSSPVGKTSSSLTKPHGARKAYGRYMQSVWKVHAKRMEGTCKAYGRHMEGTKWDLSEQGKNCRSVHLEISLNRNVQNGEVGCVSFLRAGVYSSRLTFPRFPV
ncbi:hypothetical protein POVWA2_051410 [Plasmodium ovale wallikeri]|uniref:Uncharacterized protein n=1 Tax=Plasmodium ovale wallikeri TaxID=864142 RepID=A0A1A8ZQL8_PLAOA|nr:hypothetical protein POVWA1_013780 [Plasmodium ovale wallikeri]SBT46170.1 hypothetical protein POVWA2_051410 [Plasmodium ovale wallikeri]